MLSAFHDEIKAGKSKAAPSSLTQLAAARLERRGAEVVRSGLLPPAFTPATPTSSARVIAFPRPAQRRPSPMPDAAACWSDTPQHDSADALHQQHPAPFQAKSAETARCFTVADRIALLEWNTQGSGGYARVVLEEGMPDTTPDGGSYVLLYRRHDLFANLGLTRRASEILVWRCSDGTGCGTYPTMAAALADLPPAVKAS